ncbi:unnamed protein product [Arctia plantaginis]|uniref:Uncharacterized protein n=1 Tax=Arctia plantaginis TaxID=874455 RepID=A0A8S0Z805_ARCPL|nr:unnamed protein product [Arctia plantaginis]CAB3243601.1 unnamed protein product [Arctia plantaginis]
MCDCAETFRRKSCPRPGGEEPDSRSSPDRPDRNKAVLLAFSALLCGLFGFMLYSLDRRTIKKILTMLGLGFLIAQPTKSEPHKPCIPRPNPCLKRPDPSEPKVVSDSPVPKTCKCREKKPSTCDAPPSPPPSCLPPPPPPEKKCQCCPNS